jgi:hypothetical protein
LYVLLAIGQDFVLSDENAGAAVAEIVAKVERLARKKGHCIARIASFP